MPRRRGTDKMVRPLSAAKIESLERGERGVPRRILLPERRPIDEWPIPSETFKQRAAYWFEEKGISRERVVRRVVSEVAGAWATSDAGRNAWEMASQWGDHRSGVMLVDWQLFYEVQDRKENPLPNATMPAVSSAVELACKELGLDYKLLNNVPERVALAGTPRDPFFVVPETSHRDYCHW